MLIEMDVTCKNNENHPSREQRIREIQPLTPNENGDCSIAGEFSDVNASMNKDERYPSSADGYTTTTTDEEDNERERDGAGFVSTNVNVCFGNSIESGSRAVQSNQQCPAGKKSKNRRRFKRKYYNKGNDNNANAPLGRCRKNSNSTDGGKRFRNRTRKYRTIEFPKAPRNTNDFLIADHGYDDFKDTDAEMPSSYNNYNSEEDYYNEYGKQNYEAEVRRFELEDANGEQGNVPLKLPMADDEIARYKDFSKFQLIREVLKHKERVEDLLRQQSLPESIDPTSPNDSTTATNNIQSSTEVDLPAMMANCSYSESFMEEANSVQQQEPSNTDQQQQKKPNMDMETFPKCDQRDDIDMVA